MTAQISDTFVYLKCRFSLAGINGSSLFHPEQIGLEVEPISTACWRGFKSTYTIADERLYLSRLRVGLSESDRSLADRGEGLVCFGKKLQRTGQDGYGFSDFLHPVDFTGGLLLASNFIKEMYVHMGFHPAYKYREVHELIFDSGTLLSAVDRSEQMREFREMLSGEPLSPTNPLDGRAIQAWVERAFSLDYKL
ncbi:MAG: hypothetical protein N5P05_004081 (plasmid) [Chroococcopsis gigantea SAG 12.99]|nr:hypothetical protein [Chroococcopsis gigantea SAG 12.99]